MGAPGLVPASASFPTAYCHGGFHAPAHARLDAPKTGAPLIRVSNALPWLPRRRWKKPFAAPLVTEITLASTFYPAEEYHQNYHDKNPLRYRYYRSGCGRDVRLRELWGVPVKP